MAQRVQIILEDDIDGGEASETMTFSLDGVTYEIDLNAKNAQALRDNLAGFIGAGRRVAGRRSKSNARHSRTGDSELSKIRVWARENGHKVADRGRISQEIRDAYAAR